jgi:hypothetical protein
MAGQRLLHPISWEIATLPTVFTTPRLAIRIDKTRSIPDSWHRAGFIYPVISIDNQDYEGSSIPINFGGTIIDIPFREYRIKFSPVEWLDKSLNLYLKIFELDTSMGINAASNTPPPIGNEVITTIATTTTATILRPLNSIFANGYIVNNSNRALYVSFTDTPTITAASPNSLVPSKGNIEIPENYTGLIQGIWANADVNGKAEIHQVNYI